MKTFNCRLAALVDGHLKNEKCSLRSLLFTFQASMFYGSRPAAAEKAQSARSVRPGDKIPVRFVRTAFVRTF